jgi:AraC-like DNA-binding protein
MKPDEVDKLAEYMRSQLSGRVRELRLLARDNGLILQGRAYSYYAKQLAQALVRKVTGLPLLANEINVSESPEPRSLAGRRVAEVNPESARPDEPHSRKTTGANGPMEPPVLSRCEDQLQALRQAIEKMMPYGRPTIEVTAAAVGLHGRALGRWLDGWGVPYEALLDQVRRARAVELLRTGRRSMTDVALLLGYSEIKVFPWKHGSRRASLWERLRTWLGRPLSSWARLRAWFPSRECRFKSCLRHLVTLGLTANNAVSPVRCPGSFGEILGKPLGTQGCDVAPPPEATDGVP